MAVNRAGTKCTIFKRTPTEGRSLLGCVRKKELNGITCFIGTTNKICLTL